MTGPLTRRGLLHLVADRLAAAERFGGGSVDARFPVAGPTSRRATADDLRALAAEAGLGGRLESVVQVARRSIRLEVATGARGAGPPPQLPETGNDAAAALRFPGRSVPGSAAAPPMLDAVVVVPSDGTATAAIHPGSEAHEAGCWGPGGSPCFPLRLSREVVLPRAWSAAMETFDLDPAEQQAWQELRRRLAAWQGVALGDEAEPGTILHRLGGYPDERQGDMPLLCELLDQGLELDGEPPRAHPHGMAVEAQGRWRRWRLLLQLSADDRLGWSWGGSSRRAYVWIDESDLRAGRFARVRALLQ